MTRSPATPLPPPKECRRLREAASLTQAQLATQVGVTRETVRAWETGRTTPRGRKRETYAKVLARLAGAADAAEGAAREVEGAAGEAEGTAEPERTAEPRRPEPSRKTPRPKKAAAQERPVRDIAPDIEVSARQEPLAMPVHQKQPMPGVAQTVTAVAESVSAGPPEETGSLTPDQAFDALYTFCAPALVRQTYLLCGRRELARESVERAFQLAWQRWPEVAVDRDPAGWVRAAAYEYALAPWHRYRPRYRHPEAPPADPADRALLGSLLALPAPHRRTLLLYDGVGLDLADTAAETEASTPAAATRLMHARETVAGWLPELADPSVLHDRLARLASAERLRAAQPKPVRLAGERRARFWTRAAIAFTVALIGATALTVRTAPTQYEPPIPPGQTVRGVPPKPAPGPLSAEQLALREKLRNESATGPERLIPRVE
ncbi:helix-turn-helix domain-containing protein [Streptomyces sp. NPDC059477]|uniref:helix-turn-helix domain-containing protein n=1 Tax=Streptomyces sp. NPDC059477 TaxID=3346847 RepID=UPI00368DBAF7